MTSDRSKYPKPNFWSVEPKAPSLVSLSVRDHNILRPPRRSSSLRAAATGLKKGLSSHQTSAASAQEALKTLHRGKFNSCSSLHVGKTRNKAAPSNLGIGQQHQESEGDQEQRISYDAESSDSNLTLSEFFEPDYTMSNPTVLTSRFGEPRIAYDIPSTGSTETVIRSECQYESRSSSLLSYDTARPKSQNRQHSAKRLFSKVMGTMQKKRRSVQLQQQNDDRVEEWRQQALSKSYTEGDTRELGSENEVRLIDADVLESITNEPQTSYIATELREPSTANTLQHDLLPQELSPRKSPISQILPDEPRVSSQGTSVASRQNEAPRLRQPIRARITARADMREASLTSKEYLWTIIQVHAEVPQIAPNQLSRENSIAVAIVLDNSRLATRKDVKKACLEVMTLATSLQEGVDHVGVYCTSGIHLADTCLLSLSLPLSLSQLESKLQEVPNRPRDSYRVQDAFLQAAQALRTLQMQSRFAALRVKEDIVIVTSSALGLSSCFQGDLDGFRVHLVNPSLIPYSNKVRRQLVQARKPMLSTHERSGSNGDDQQMQEHGFLNGWLLDSARCISDDCEEHKSHSLIDAIALSKSQADAGRISNISITIHERDDAVIEEVIGDLAHKVLLPGQMVSIPVRLRLQSLAPRLSIGSVSDFRCSSQMSMMDAISDLELALGNHFSELFEVQVNYSHSFFPENTRLEVRESCWLPRTLPQRRMMQFQEDEYDDSIQPLHNCRVQKQLALCMAVCNSPSEALRDLEEFLPEGVSDGVANFLDALKRRLKHRVALFADVSFMDYLLASEYVEQAPETLEQPYERYLREFIHEQPDEEAPDTPSTVVRRRPRPVEVVPSNENEEIYDEEEARRIWQHIRRTSRPGEPPKLDEEEVEFVHEDTDAQIEELRHTALKHGRKISTATLRSLAKDFRRVSSSLIEEEEENDGLD